ncbi:MAG: zinc/cadmium-binding protein [Candidatus Methanolliviera sp. GoM_oil]|nr:MAG: zinc/cadmium-binding protein [Candidatus Methanolliviera sp. GoM_oil]
MKKTTSIVAVIICIVIVGSALYMGIRSQESPAPLDDWNGTWVNVGTMLDDPAMDAVYEAMGDAANAAAGDGSFTADDAKSFLYAMHKSDFGDLGIEGNTVTYYNVDGTVRCKCEYESAGIETVAFGEEEFNWYKFELTSEDAACSEYKYLILCEKHSHEGGMLHFHMRYGDTSFDDLINNPAYGMWYPTLAAEDTTVGDVVEGYAEGAPMMGYMMLAWFGDPWRDFDPDFLPAEIIDISGTYMATGEVVFLDIEGNFIPDFIEQVTATVVVEQHGSLLKAIWTEDGGEGVFQGSTVGNNIMISNAGYMEAPGMGKIRFESVGTGNIEKGANGLEIYVNWIWRIYDSDNNLIFNCAATHVWERVED